MAVTITTAANYWIAPNALTITLNALGEANRIQASVASGAVIMVYMRGIKPADPSDPDTALNGDGLEFDNGHNYRRWPLTISPTYFNSNDEKYIYVAIPRKASVGTDAVVVFPSQKLDIYGYSVKEVPKRNARGQMIDEDGYPTDDITKAVKEEEQDEQLGTDDYFYIWLQGIITETNGVSPRDWDAHCESGYLDSDEAISSLETDWYKWDPISGTVTFLKEIFMDAGSIFVNLIAKTARIVELEVTEKFTAIKAYIDEIRSSNFEEGLSDGSGFRLTNDNGDGASELEVDFLKVRKKATFMELEIRKETYVGGNQNYSPAGSVIYRVEYLDRFDEPLGYKTKKVPWLLKGFAFLGGPFAGAYHLATKRRIYVGMTDEEWKKCHHFRCYLISDDGTTATRNWWRYGDQAKCQSFNKAATVKTKHDNTYQSGEIIEPDPADPMRGKDNTPVDPPEPIETSYWWRMVTNTGSKLLEDGYVYDFVDFPYEGWDVVIDGTRHRYTDIEKRGFRDPGSGMPMAGDTLVCIGNRIEENRMNLINISTTGEENDPPSIRGWRGIHNFKMDDSNRMFKISPEETRFRSKHFYLENDDDEAFRVPLERGEWEIGQRYRWYDRVSWDGSIWLCVVADEYVWQDANGNDYRELDVTDIDQGEGSFTYYAYDRQIPDLDEDGREDGDLVYTGTDHFYASGKVGSTTVYKIKVYTYLEPSDEHNAVWLCEVSKGTEITSSEIHYAASLDGINHPDDESDAWKDTIEATGVLAGQYLWTRTTTYYRDKNDPDREPTRTYSVARWGIDGDGISEINSYYLARLSEATINRNNDTFPMPGDAGWNAAAADAKWFDTFSACAAANGGVGQMQGWMVWEKTVIIYDMAPNPDGSARPKPDLINYNSSRIGQDGQIGQEEYYMLAASDDFATVFGNPSQPASYYYAKSGIRWYTEDTPSTQDLPAAENWRLSGTTPNINTAMWSPVMPTYQEGSAKKYLWNFEQRIDGQGTEYATKPVCIGNHARGIKGVLELYALSAAGAPQTSVRHIPNDIWGANGNSETDYSHSDPSKPLTWTDEIYDRAPTELLPYQWNWTRTLYETPRNAADTARDPSTGLPYEDHYHVSAVRGTKGEDGTGSEFVYMRTATATPPSTPLSSGKGEISPQGVANGNVAYDNKLDDWVPNGWSDNPQGIDHDHPYEWVSKRVSTAYAGTGGHTGGHTWGAFSTPEEWAKWGYNGQDGDGTEYVFIRTKTDTPPVLLSADGGTAADYQSQEWRPYVSGSGRTDIETNDGTTAKPRCTDDPKGTTRDWPYEWVAKRTMTAPSAAAADYGQRKWQSYYDCTAGNSHKMSKWSTYTTLRLDIDNEMDMVQTSSQCVVEKARTVTTVVKFYDGSKEVNISTASLSISGGPASSVATYSHAAAGNGQQLSWAFAVGKTMAEAYGITIGYIYNGITYTAVFTVSASMGRRVYQLRPNHSSLACQRNANNTLADPPALSLAISRIDGDSSKEIQNPTADATYKDGDVTLTVRYSTQSMPSSSSGGSAWPKANSVQVSGSGSVTNVYIALFNADGVMLDRETVPVVRDGKNGSNSVRLDLDNENDTMLYNSEGTLKSGSVTSTASMFDGSTNVSGSTTFSISARDGVSASQATISGRVITVTGMSDSATKATVTVQGVYTDGFGETHTKTAVLTIKKQVGGSKYWITTNPSSIPYNASTDTPATSTVSVIAHKIDVDGNQSTVNIPTVFANAGTLTRTGTGIYSLTIDNSEVNEVTVRLAMSSTSTTYYDMETIPVVKAEDGVAYTIDCADVVKPSDTVLPVKIIRSLGESVSRLELTGASSTWGVGLSASVSGGGSASVEHTNSRVTLSNFTASTEMTLTLKRNGVTVATKTVRCVADGKDGQTGETGHVGRWYYYAGVYDGNPLHYKMEKTRSPFVKESASVENYWMLDFGGVEPASHEKTASVSPTSANQKEWTQMLATFKYIITEAVFANFAKLGTFFINKDWMLSKFGIVYFSDGQSTVISSDSSYNSFVSTYGVEPYTTFEPSWPTSSRPGVMNFCPNYAVDGRSGKTYQNDAYVKGQIVATSGEISGTMKVSGILNVGTYASGYKSIRLNPNDDNGAGISGYNGTTKVFRLGFSNNGKGYLAMGGSWYQEDIAWLMGDNGEAVLCASNGDVGSSYVNLTRIVSGTQYSARVAMDASGKFIISSNNWPGAADVPSGGLYVSSGVVMVKS